MAAFSFKTADSMGRRLSSLDKSKRSMTWNAPVGSTTVPNGKSWGKVASSILRKEYSFRLELGRASLMDVSPVASRVILFGGLGVGLVVGDDVDGVGKADG